MKWPLAAVTAVALLLADVADTLAARKGGGGSRSSASRSGSRSSGRSSSRSRSSGSKGSGRSSGSKSSGGSRSRSSGGSRSSGSRSGGKGSSRSGGSRSGGKGSGRSGGARAGGKGSSRTGGSRSSGSGRGRSGRGGSRGGRATTGKKSSGRMSGRGPASRKPTKSGRTNPFAGKKPGGKARKPAAAAKRPTGKASQARSKSAAKSPFAPTRARSPGRGVAKRAGQPASPFAPRGKAAGTRAAVMSRGAAPTRAQPDLWSALDNKILGTLAGAGGDAGGAAAAGDKAGDMYAVTYARRDDGPNGGELYGLYSTQAAAEKARAEVLKWAAQIKKIDADYNIKSSSWDIVRVNIEPMRSKSPPAKGDKTATISPDKPRKETPQGRTLLTDGRRALKAASKVGERLSKAAGAYDRLKSMFRAKAQDLVKKGMLGPKQVGWYVRSQLIGARQRLGAKLTSFERKVMQRVGWGKSKDIARLAKGARWLSNSIKYGTAAYDVVTAPGWSNKFKVAAREALAIGLGDLAGKQVARLIPKLAVALLERFGERQLLRMAAGAIGGPGLVMGMIAADIAVSALTSDTARQIFNRLVSTGGR